MTRAYFTGRITRADELFGHRILCTECDMYSDPDYGSDESSEIVDEEKFVCSSCRMRNVLYGYKNQRTPAPNLYLVSSEEEMSYQELRKAA